MKQRKLVLLTALALAATGAWANMQQDKHAGQQAQSTRTGEPTPRVRMADQPSTPNVAGQPERASGQRGATAQRDAGQAQGRGDARTYALLVVPIQVASNDNLNNGCWARIYENPSFGGSPLTVIGPIDIASLDGTVADDWNGADSLITGGAATVTTYGASNFREQKRSYGPATREQNLPSGPLEKIESVRISCQA